jgi:hypothetical protein
MANRTEEALYEAFMQDTINKTDWPLRGGVAPWSDLNEEQRSHFRKQFAAQAAGPKADAETKLYLETMLKHGWDLDEVEPWADLDEEQRDHYRRAFPGYVAPIGDLIEGMYLRDHEVKALRTLIEGRKKKKALEWLRSALDENADRAPEAYEHLCKLWSSDRMEIVEISPKEIVGLSLAEHNKRTRQGGDITRYLIRCKSQVTPAVAIIDHPGDPVLLWPSNSGPVPIKKVDQVWIIRPAKEN